MKITEDWERDRRISVNPNKCKIAARIQHLEELDLLNNIHIDNTPVQTPNTVKILGYTFNFIKTSSTHIANITQKAQINIHKLHLQKLKITYTKLSLDRSLSTQPHR